MKLKMLLPFASCLKMMAVEYHLAIVLLHLQLCFEFDYVYLQYCLYPIELKYYMCNPYMSHYLILAKQRYRML